MQISDYIIYKNNQLLAFNKPGGLAVQPDLTEDTSLMDLAAIYAKHPVFPIHRIDRPASGIVLFAKQQKSLTELSRQFKAREVKKTYLAIVKNKPPEDSGTLVHHIKTLRNNKSIALDEPEKGTKEARLSYELVTSTDRYHILKVNLHTGRQHQIRAQFAAIGCPIKGDVKYGFRRRNRDRSIDLHHWKLSFHHPVTGEEVNLVAPLPEGKIWEEVG